MIEKNLNYLKEKYDFDNSDLEIIFERIKELNKSIKKIQSIENEESLEKNNPLKHLNE